MSFFHHLYFLALLVTWFPLTSGKEYSTTPSNIIANVKDFLIREGDKISAKNGSRAPLIPNSDIVGQIIGFLNCGYFPLSPNSHLEYSLDYENGQFRSFQACDRHFQTIQKPESLRVYCLYKQWIFNKIQCKINTCPRLTAPVGGYLSTTDNTYNTTVYFWCSLGFNINGTDRLSCEENGLWNFQPPTCQISTCRPLSPPWHGFVSSQEDTDVNETVLFTCESEYTIVGDAVLRCEQNGRWNTSAPVCQKTCIVPSFTNRLGDVHFIPGFKIAPPGSRVHQGQRVIFSCKASYTIPSSGISTCIGGSWRPTIQCRKTCTVVEIANGKHVLSKDFFTVEYSCLPGHQLIGRQKLSCTPNNTWDGEVPICMKMCTLAKTPLVLAYRNANTYEIIPFGTPIKSGTKFSAMCASNSSEVSFSECMDGELGNISCKQPGTQLNENYLEVWNEDTWQWERICAESNYACRLFGYGTALTTSCSMCLQLDRDKYIQTSHIVFGSRLYNYYEENLECIKCL